MNREILFRGKRKDNGEWVEGCYLETQMSGVYIINTKAQAKGKMPGKVTIGDKIIHHEVDPATVGQFTGLKDKNGREIYEGDIVRGCFIGKKISYEIVYSTDACFYGQSLPYNNLPQGGRQTVGLNNISDWAEIIGNVHDNPELLEVSL